MQLPIELIKKWTILRSEGDAEQIAEAAETSSQTIRNAFSTGKCSDKVFEEMAKFYEAKAKLIKQYI